MTTVTAKTKAGRLIAVQIEQSVRPGHVKVMGFEFNEDELIDALSNQSNPPFDTDIIDTIKTGIR